METNKTVYFINYEKKMQKYVNPSKKNKLKKKY